MILVHKDTLKAIVDLELKLKEAELKKVEQMFERLSEMHIFCVNARKALEQENATLRQMLSGK